MSFLCPEHKAAEAAQCDHTGNSITDPAQFMCEVDAFFCNEDITAADHGHEQGRDEGNEVTVTVGTVLEQPDRTGPKREDSKRLIGPCEITPNNLKINEYHSEYAQEQRNSDHKTLWYRTLIQMQEIRHDESC